MEMGSVIVEKEKKVLAMAEYFAGGHLRFVNGEWRDDNGDAIDAVVVTRCKDCRWRGIEECTMFYRCECGEQHTWETDNDFCSYGKRREE